MQDHRVLLQRRRVMHGLVCAPGSRCWHGCGRRSPPLLPLYHQSVAARLARAPASDGGRPGLGGGEGLGGSPLASGSVGGCSVPRCRKAPAPQRCRNPRRRMVQYRSQRGGCRPGIRVPAAVLNWRERGSDGLLGVASLLCRCASSRRRSLLSSPNSTTWRVQTARLAGTTASRADGFEEWAKPRITDLLVGEAAPAGAGRLWSPDRCATRLNLIDELVVKTEVGGYREAGTEDDHKRHLRLLLSAPLLRTATFAIAATGSRDPSAWHNLYHSKRHPRPL